MSDVKGVRSSVGKSLLMMSVCTRNQYVNQKNIVSVYQGMKRSNDLPSKNQRFVNK